MKNHSRSGMIAFALALAVGCDRQQSTPPLPPANSSNGASPPATQAAPVAAVRETPPTTPVAPKSKLPRAEDVLPAGEVSEGSLVVFGDGYRFQIKPEYEPTTLADGTKAHSGVIKGMLDDAKVTLFVTKESFTGDLDALTKRQQDAAKAAGAKIQADMEVKVMTDGSLAPAHRFAAEGKETVELQVLVVDKGTAYIFHAQTPQAPNAYLNVGSDMMIRGSTLHIGPPPPK